MSHSLSLILPTPYSHQSIRVTSSMCETLGSPYICEESMLFPHGHCWQPCCESGEAPHRTKLVQKLGRYCCLVACLGKSTLNRAPTPNFLVKCPFMLKPVFLYNRKLPTIIQHIVILFLMLYCIKNKLSKELSF